MKRRFQKLFDRAVLFGYLIELAGNMHISNTASSVNPCITCIKQGGAGKRNDACKRRARGSLLAPLIVAGSSGAFRAFCVARASSNGNRRALCDSGVALAAPAEHSAIPGSTRAAPVEHSGGSIGQARATLFEHSVDAGRARAAILRNLPNPRRPKQPLGVDYTKMSSLNDWHLFGV